MALVCAGLIGVLLCGCGRDDAVIVGHASDTEQAEESPAPTDEPTPAPATATPTTQAPAPPPTAGQPSAQPSTSTAPAPAPAAATGPCSASGSGLALAKGSASSHAVQTAQDLMTAALGCDSGFLTTLATQDRTVLSLNDAQPATVFAVPDGDQRYLALARALSSAPALADDEWIWPGAAAGDDFTGYQVSISADGKWTAFYQG